VIGDCCLCLKGQSRRTGANRNWNRTLHAAVLERRLVELYRQSVYLAPGGSTISSKVGTKGNIVIDKGIRDRLGVQPGWETIQLLRNGHVEVHFLPPVQPGASAGILGPVGDVPWLREEDALREAIDQAMGDALRERYGTAESEPAG
jgi:bifunctional DNA-binding transcriptional regulator/antitoxin component of YhaV-PrlF toxin-antitoxin module